MDSSNSELGRRGDYTPAVTVEENGFSSSVTL